MNQDKEENPNRRRLLIVLGAVGAIGAIAAIATAASLALFYDPVAPYPAQFAAGNVTLNGPSTTSCKVGNQPSGDGTGIAPGYSSSGYPGQGDQSGTACATTFKYTGSLDAFLALDVSVTTNPGSDNTACNGGDSAGPSGACVPLYNPPMTNTAGDGIEVYVLGKPANGGTTQAFGIGNDQTISDPGTGDVNTSYGQTDPTHNAACAGSGDNCPVEANYAETFYVYVYWPMDEGSQQNGYMNSNATITLEEHAVQATDNPLFTCSAITDGQLDPGGFGNYDAPDQPQFGWGGGFSSGNADSSPAVGDCPTADSNGTGTDDQYVVSGGAVEPPVGDYLMTLYHPHN